MPNLRNTTKAIIYFGVFSLSLSAFSYYLSFENDPAHFLWDFHVYIRAVSEFNNSQDAYSTSHHLIFVYPPIFLYALSSFESILQPSLLALMFLTLLCFSHLKMRPLLIGMLFCAGLFYLQGVRAFMSGNVTSYFHLIIIFSWVALPHSRLLFFASLCAAASLKPYFLAYLLLPAAANWPSQKYLLPAALTVTGCISIFVAQYLITPIEMENFVRAIATQTGAMNENLTNTDLGVGIYAAALHWLNSKYVALTLHVSVILLMILFNIKLLRIKLPEDIEPIARLWLPIMIACLANPRLKIYDEVIMAGSAAVIIIILGQRISYIVPAAIGLLFCCIKYLPVRTEAQSQFTLTLAPLSFFESYIFVGMAVYLLIKYLMIQKRHMSPPILGDKPKIHS